MAHPDDEVLGCGAAAATLATNGTPVRACVLSGDADARANRPASSELREDTLRAQEILGFGAPILGAFPNIALNTIPHLELVQFIERAILESGATRLFTHHPRDANHDHLQVSIACQAAVHLWRRRSGVPRVIELHLMETLSSTDWSLPDGRGGFDPDTFMPVAEEMIDRKITALQAYRGVVRPRPHSRSIDVVKALATIRGAQCGSPWAEAFQCAYRVMSAEAT